MIKKSALKGMSSSFFQSRPKKYSMCKPVRGDDFGQVAMDHILGGPKLHYLLLRSFHVHRQWEMVKI